MKRLMVSLAMVLAVAVSIPAFAEASTYFGFQIGVGNAPPPPRVVFDAPPRMEMEPGSRVMYLSEDRGYDMFRYGSYYYVSNGGYWYRSRNYRGHFRAIDARQVPQQVYNVPSQRWHHRPMDNNRRMNQGRGRGPGQDQGQGRDRGRDQGQGQDHYNH